MKKQIFITIALGLMLIFSCSSPNKEKSTTTQSDQKVTEAPKTETATPQAAPATTPQTKETSPGEKLFTEKTCTTCHKPDTKLVGPSLKDIAAAYNGDKGKLKSFLKGEAKPIVDPSQESVMHPQIAITKALPDDQLNQIMDYILSNK
ncbi:MAG: c-type cytochrome [Candidatus Saccharibacteria bacterium]